MRIAICIDYDNLHTVYTARGVLDLVTKVLMKLPPPQAGMKSECEVRLYGGWYEGQAMTMRAQDISAHIQRDFPALVRLTTLAGELAAVQVTVELAVALLDEPSHHLLNTYRKKGHPQNVRTESPHAVGCSDVSCLFLL